MAKLSLVVNLKNQAITQYSGFDFESMVAIEGLLYGIDDTGVHLIAGRDDNGADIDAYAELAIGDIGSENNKRVLAFYLGGETDGSIEVVSTFDKETASSKTKTVNPATKNKAITMKTTGDRSQLGRYLTLKIQNVDGSFFHVNKVQGAFTLLPLRILK